MTIYKQKAWSLDDLFPALDAPEIEVALEQLEEKVAAFAQLRDSLQPEISAEAFFAIIKESEAISQQIYDLYGFGSLSFAADTQNQQAQTYLARIGQIYASAQNRKMFFGLWWQDLDNENADRLLADAGQYEYWLREMRNHKPHTLSEAEEKIINLKDVNGSSALQKIYESITNRYLFTMIEDGEEKKLTRGELSGYYYSSDPAVRASAYQELYRVYADDAPVLGQIYQFKMRDWRSEQVDLRNYKSPINVRNRGNDIPDEVVDVLLQAVREHAPLFHKYFDLKAKWLGMEKMRRYDLYAKVSEGAAAAYDFTESAELVLNSYREFSPQLADLAQRIFDEDHYDSEVRQGKRTGAFCSTLGPKNTPWVLQSFTGKPRDIATMAHELGHAIHSMLAEHHSIVNQHPCLPLAETASTFGEMLLLDKLLADADEEVRRDLLFSALDDSYATIMRQSYFALFEIEAHEAIHNGASVDDLCDIYLAGLKEQFGESIELSDDFRYEWVAIPHFFATPFYVYAYSFGQLLALSLYKRYKEEGDAMLPEYLALLSAGGSQSPVDILKNAGVDPYDIDFWRGGFDIVKEQLAALEALPIPEK